MDEQHHHYHDIELAIPHLKYQVCALFKMQQ